MSPLVVVEVVVAVEPVEPVEPEEPVEPVDADEPVEVLVVVPLVEPEEEPVAVPLLVPDVVPEVPLVEEVPVEEVPDEAAPVEEVSDEEVRVMVPVALELVPVSAAVPGVADADPESPPPQPASAIVTLLNSAGQITRPDTNPRLAFLMRSPKKMTSVPAGAGRSHLSAGARDSQQRLGLLANSHEAVLVPRQPRCHRPSCR